VPVPVNGTETVTTCAAEIVAAVNALSNLPVTAANVNGIVTFTARNKGTLGNAIDLRFAWLGAIGGETLPTSFAATIVAMAGGATDPTVTAAFAALGDQLFDYIVQPWTDAGNLNACQAAMGFTGGRWSWNRMVWGMVFTAYSGTLSQAQTLGLTRNDPFTSILPVDPASPTPIWEWLASAIAVTAVALGDDPARPIQGIEIPNVLSPPPGTGRVTLAGRNTLLYSGMSCFEVGDDGVSRISRLVSTYQTNQFGQNDIAYLSVEKNFTLMASLRDLRTQYNADFPRFKLAHDGTRAGLAKQVVTPSLLYAWLVARMRWQEEEMGWLDDVDAMIPNIDVEINAQNPDRADMIFPPPLIGQLRDLAVLAQFRVNNS
jgi:phage tail sheath gpL-like